LNLKYGWLLVQLRPRVLHRLQGRLRIHIPALKKVHHDFHDISTLLLKGFNFPEGIHDVSIDYRTGNLLILFNQELIIERQVLGWIHDIRHIVEYLFLKFINMEEAEIINSELKLKEFLSQVSNNGTVIDKNFRIPDDVWKTN